MTREKEKKVGKDQLLLEASRLGQLDQLETILNQLHMLKLKKRTNPLASLRKTLGPNNIRDPLTGFTCLHHAALNNHADCVRLILAHGAKINAVDYKGSSALHLAAWAGNLDVVRCLLEHEQQQQQQKLSASSSGSRGRHQMSPAAAANSSAGDYCTQQPMEQQFQQDSQTTTIDINLCNNDNQTPLSLAAQFGHHSVVSELLARGANVFTRNTQLESALDLACLHGRLDTVDLLLKNVPQLQLELRRARASLTTTTATQQDVATTATIQQQQENSASSMLSGRAGQQQLVGVPGQRHKSERSTSSFVSSDQATTSTTSTSHHHQEQQKREESPPKASAAGSSASSSPSSKSPSPQAAAPSTAQQRSRPSAANAAWSALLRAGGRRPTTTPTKSNSTDSSSASCNNSTAAAAAAGENQSSPLLRFTVGTLSMRSQKQETPAEVVDGNDQSNDASPATIRARRATLTAALTGNLSSSLSSSAATAAHRLPLLLGGSSSGGGKSKLFKSFDNFELVAPSSGRDKATDDDETAAAQAAAAGPLLAHSPLHLATRRGHLEVASLLLYTYGANLCQVTTLGSVLHEIALSNNMPGNKHSDMMIGLFFDYISNKQQQQQQQQVRAEHAQHELGAAHAQAENQDSQEHEHEEKMGRRVRQNQQNVSLLEQFLNLRDLNGKSVFEVLSQINNRSAQEVKRLIYELTEQLQSQQQQHQQHKQHHQQEHTQSQFSGHNLSSFVTMKRAPKHQQQAYQLESGFAGTQTIDRRQARHQRHLSGAMQTTSFNVVDHATLTRQQRSHQQQQYQEKNSRFNNNNNNIEAAGNWQQQHSQNALMMTRSVSNLNNRALNYHQHQSQQQQQPLTLMNVDQYNSLARTRKPRHSNQSAQSAHSFDCWSSASLDQQQAAANYERMWLAAAEGEKASATLNLNNNNNIENMNPIDRNSSTSTSSIIINNNNLKNNNYPSNSICDNRKQQQHQQQQNQPHHHHHHSRTKDKRSKSRELSSLLLEAAAEKMNKQQQQQQQMLLYDNNNGSSSVCNGERESAAATPNSSCSTFENVTAASGGGGGGLVRSHTDCSHLMSRFFVTPGDEEKDNIGRREHAHSLHQYPMNPPPPPGYMMSAAGHNHPQMVNASTLDRKTINRHYHVYEHQFYPPRLLPAAVTTSTAGLIDAATAARLGCSAKQVGVATQLVGGGGVEFENSAHARVGGGRESLGMQFQQQQQHRASTRSAVFQSASSERAVGIKPERRDLNRRSNKLIHSDTNVLTNNTGGAAGTTTNNQHHHYQTQQPPASEPINQIISSTSSSSSLSTTTATNNNNSNNSRLSLNIDTSAVPGAHAQLGSCRPFNEEQSRASAANHSHYDQHEHERFDQSLQQQQRTTKGSQQVNNYQVNNSEKSTLPPATSTAVASTGGCARQDLVDLQRRLMAEQQQQQQQQQQVLSLHNSYSLESHLSEPHLFESTRRALMHDFDRMIGQELLNRNHNQIIATTSNQQAQVHESYSANTLLSSLPLTINTEQQQHNGMLVDEEEQSSLLSLDEHRRRHAHSSRLMGVSLDMDRMGERLTVSGTRILQQQKQQPPKRPPLPASANALKHQVAGAQVASSKRRTSGGGAMVATARTQQQQQAPQKVKSSAPTSSASSNSSIARLSHSSGHGADTYDQVEHEELDPTTDEGGPPPPKPPRLSLIQARKQQQQQQAHKLVTANQQPLAGGGQLRRALIYDLPGTTPTSGLKQQQPSPLERLSSMTTNSVGGGSSRSLAGAAALGFGGALTEAPKVKPPPPPPSAAHSPMATILRGHCTRSTASPGSAIVQSLSTPLHVNATCGLAEPSSALDGNVSSSGTQQCSGSNSTSNPSSLENEHNCHAHQQYDNSSGRAGGRGGGGGARATGGLLKMASLTSNSSTQSSSGASLSQRSNSSSAAIITRRAPSHHHHHQHGLIISAAHNQAMGGGCGDADSGVCTSNSPASMSHDTSNSSSSDQQSSHVGGVTTTSTTTTTTSGHHHDSDHAGAAESWTMNELELGRGDRDTEHRRRKSAADTPLSLQVGAATHFDHQQQDVAMQQQPPSPKTAQLCIEEALMPLSRVEIETSNQMTSPLVKVSKDKYTNKNSNNNNAAIDNWLKRNDDSSRRLTTHHQKQEKSPSAGGEFSDYENCQKLQQQQLHSGVLTTTSSGQHHHSASSGKLDCSSGRSSSCSSSSSSFVCHMLTAASTPGKGKGKGKSDKEANVADDQSAGGATSPTVSSCATDSSSLLLLLADDPSSSNRQRHRLACEHDDDDDEEGDYAAHSANTSARSSSTTTTTSSSDSSSNGGGVTGVSGVSTVAGKEEAEVDENGVTGTVNKNEVHLLKVLKEESCENGGDQVFYINPSELKRIASTKRNCSSSSRESVQDAETLTDEELCANIDKQSGYIKFTLRKRALPATATSSPNNNPNPNEKQQQPEQNSISCNGATGEMVARANDSRIEQVVDTTASSNIDSGLGTQNSSAQGHKVVAAGQAFGGSTATVAHSGVKKTKLQLNSTPVTSTTKTTAPTVACGRDSNNNINKNNQNDVDNSSSSSKRQKTPEDVLVLSEQEQKFNHWFTSNFPVALLEYKSKLSAHALDDINFLNHPKLLNEQILTEIGIVNHSHQQLILERVRVDLKPVDFDKLFCGLTKSTPDISTVEDQVKNVLSLLLPTLKASEGNRKADEHTNELMSLATFLSEELKGATHLTGKINNVHQDRANQDRYNYLSEILVKLSELNPNQHQLPLGYRLRLKEAAKYFSSLSWSSSQQQQKPAATDPCTAGEQNTSSSSMRIHIRHQKPLERRQSSSESSASAEASVSSELEVEMDTTTITTTSEASSVVSCTSNNSSSSSSSCSSSSSSSSSSKDSIKSIVLIGGVSNLASKSLPPAQVVMVEQTKDVTSKNTADENKSQPLTSDEQSLKVDWMNSEVKSEIVINSSNSGSASGSNSSSRRSSLVSEAAKRIEQAAAAAAASSSSNKPAGCSSKMSIISSKNQQQQQQQNNQSLPPQPPVAAARKINSSNNNNNMVTSSNLVKKEHEETQKVPAPVRSTFCWPPPQAQNSTTQSSSITTTMKPIAQDNLTKSTTIGTSNSNNQRAKPAPPAKPAKLVAAAAGAASKSIVASAASSSKPTAISRSITLGSHKYN